MQRQFSPSFGGLAESSKMFAKTTRKTLILYLNAYLYALITMPPSGGSTFCPMTSPMGDSVYVTDTPAANRTGVSLSECASECAFYGALLGSSSKQCRCFNYDVNVANCSLFEIEPTSGAVDVNRFVTAYQFSDFPIRSSLIDTVPSSACAFPYEYGNSLHYGCRYNPHTTSIGQKAFGCIQPSGQQAFCIPQPTAYTSVNVALNKPSLQRSTYGTSYAALANDGIMSTASCTYYTDVNPWWAVDLLQPYVVKEVAVVNVNTYAYRLDNFLVKVGNLRPPTGQPLSESDYTLCAQYSGSVGPLATALVVCPVYSLPSRFVIIQGSLSAANPICLAEVLVYGEATANVALNKNAYLWYYAMSIAKMAIDGNITTQSFSINYASPWWFVDLGLSYVVIEVDVFNGINTDAGVNQVKNFQVKLSNEQPINQQTISVSTTLCAQYNGSVPALGNGTVFCPRNLPSFRYVIVQGTSSTPETLCLAEVIVYGALAPPHPIVRSSSCSYPYTYEGVLYYRCMQNVSSATTASHQFACLTTNYTLASCYPPANFTAEYANVPVTVGGLSIMFTPSVSGWITVLQRSFQDLLSKDWSTYKYGFGSYDSYLWLGLERLYQLTNVSGTRYRLRVELQSSYTNSWYSAEYWTFSVGSEADYYKLNVNDYVGDAGDNFHNQYVYYNSDQMPFATYDHGPTGYQNSAWANAFSGGWWFNYNGYNVGCLTCSSNQFFWRPLPLPSFYLSYCRMMIKPV